MITYIPLLIALGLIGGGIFGRYFMAFYIWVYKFAYSLLQRILPDTGAFILAFLIGFFMTLIFAISGLVFAPVIPDSVWIYFSKSYLFGIIIGVASLAIAKRDRNIRHG